MEQMANRSRQTGNVVFLKGPVSSGKSSLCKALLKLDYSWRLVSDDELYFKQTIACWKEDFPNEFAKIESAIDVRNIVHAIIQNKIHYKNNTSHIYRRQAENAISKIRKNPNTRWKRKLQANIMQNISHLLTKYNVIVDSWFLSTDDIQKIAKNHAVTRVAAHCSFLNVIKRTIKRNCDALTNATNVSNVRPLKQACMSFMGSYAFIDSANDPIAVEKRAAVVKAFELINFALPKNSMLGEFSSEELENFKQRLLSNFDSDEILLFLKNDVDDVLITDNNSATENATHLIKLVLKRKFDDKHFHSAPSLEFD